MRDVLPDRPIKSLLGGFHLVSVPLLWTLSEDKESAAGARSGVAAIWSRKFYMSHFTGSRDRKAFGFSRTSWVRGFSTFPPDRGFSSNVVEKEDIEPCRA